MGKRRRPGSGGMPDLFPFLSVLACSIGVLVVIISGQNLLAVADSDQVIVLEGSVHDARGAYVECDARGVLLHPDRVRVGEAALRGEGATPFHQLLDGLAAAGGRRHLVLLVRPQGIDVYEHCRRLAEERRVPVGKDALLMGGKVIFASADRPVLDLRKEGDE